MTVPTSTTTTAPLPPPPSPPISPPPTSCTTERFSEKPQHAHTPDDTLRYTPSLASTSSLPCARQKSSEIWHTLGYLTFINPFLCILNFFYTIVTLLFCFRRIPRNLEPQLRLHLRWLYSTEDGDVASTARLVVVHLLSPVVAVPLSIVAAAVGFVWVYTEVLLGDRNEGGGLEYRSYLWVRRRWEGYVLRALAIRKDIEG